MIESLGHIKMEEHQQLSKESNRIRLKSKSPRPQQILMQPLQALYKPIFY